MKVLIKNFDVDMEIKNKGVECEVRSADGSKQLGDIVITKTGLIWCPGKTDRKNGKRLTWTEFIDYMETL